MRPNHPGARRWAKDLSAVVRAAFPPRRSLPETAFHDDVEICQPHPGFPAPDRLGAAFPDYRPVFARREPFVDAGHAAIGALPEAGGLIDAGVPGFLRRADALLLYELGWQAEADVLELGSAWGLSTTILCQALRNAGRRRHLVSVEIAPPMQRATSNAVARLGLSGQLKARPGDAAVVLAALAAEGRCFSVAFVDHDHSVEAVRQSVRWLDKLLLPNGIAVFHDFNDCRNVSEPDVYGVYRGVEEMIRDPQWDYLGIVGCCGLVRRAEPCPGRA